MDAALAIALAAGGLAVVAALAAALARRPALVAPLAIGALPFRIPVEVGGETANLLVPLYLVIAAGTLAYAWRELRLGRRATSGGALDGGAAPGPLGRGLHPGRVELAVLGAVALYALQAVYSTDVEQALKNVVLFYLPFALLLRLLVQVDWSARLTSLCLGVVLALALAFCAVGFWEYATRELLWNPRVIEANQFESYFRVNSLFFDPNIYGRFLALVMVALAGALLWSRGRGQALLASGALAVLWGGLVLTFSQSSFAALLAGLAVLAALRWGARPVVLSAAAGGLAAAALVLAFPGAVKLDLESERSLDAATSGRLDLMRGGLEMFADRPLWGYGSGSFAERFREREDVSSEQAASASHTIPITVAAEQGVVGLAVYGLVLWLALTTLFARLRALRPDGRGPPPRLLVARGVVAAAFTALVVHTLLYAAFLEDPMSWTLLGAGLALRRRLSAAAASASPASAPARTGSSSP